MNSWLQSLSASPYVAYGENADVLSRKNALSCAEVALYSTPRGIVDLNLPGIEMAVDRRVALFFQQAVLCYKMPFTFSHKGADEQFGSAPKLILKTEDGKHQVVHNRQAAHSSTLPTLVATAKDGTKITYLKSGNSEAQHNQTIGMHIEVNHVDSWIDGDDRLRDKAVGLLNRTAKGLSPIQATQLFIEDFILENKQNSRRLKGFRDEKYQTQRLISKEYKKFAREILAQAQETSFFDQLSGGEVVVQGGDEEVIRSAVFKKRYHLILEQETVESRIAKRILEAKEGAVGQKSLLEQALLKSFTNDEDRQVLEKLFVKTAEFYEPGCVVDKKVVPPAAYKAFLTKVTNFSNANKALLNTLQRDLRAEFRELSAAEFSYRSALFWTFRKKVKGWTQKEFCALYHEGIGKEISPSWVSRIENLSRVSRRNPEAYKTPLNQRRKYVTLKEAQNCAEIFGVNYGVFLPALITSRQTVP
ncbi:MAG: hypothetical protein ACK5MA_01215 [Parachlamydiaceae bacterium]